jgi:hypothetical protein
LIVVPIWVAIAERSIRSGLYPLAVACGAALLMLMPKLEDLRRNAQFRALDDRDRRWQEIYPGAYVLTPHRLEILKDHVSNDVIRDIEPLMEKLKGRVDGSQFFPEIEKALGQARFADEREKIRYVHDATRSLEELERTMKRPQSGSQ